MRAQIDGLLSRFGCSSAKVVGVLAVGAALAS